MHLQLQGQACPLLAPPQSAGSKTQTCTADAGKTASIRHTGSRLPHSMLLPTTDRCHTQVTTPACNPAAVITQPRESHQHATQLVSYLPVTANQHRQELLLHHPLQLLAAAVTAAGAAGVVTVCYLCSRRAHPLAGTAAAASARSAVHLLPFQQQCCCQHADCLEPPLQLLLQLLLPSKTRTILRRSSCLVQRRRRFN